MVRSPRLGRPPRLVTRRALGLSPAAQTTTSPDHKLGDLCRCFEPWHTELLRENTRREVSFAQGSVGISARQQRRVIYAIKCISFHIGPAKGALYNQKKSYHERDHQYRGHR